jgi:hypothetical protein
MDRKCSVAFCVVIFMLTLFDGRFPSLPLTVRRRNTQIRGIHMFTRLRWFFFDYQLHIVVQVSTELLSSLWSEGDMSYFVGWHKTDRAYVFNSAHAPNFGRMSVV